MATDKMMTKMMNRRFGLSSKRKGYVSIMRKSHGIRSKMKCNGIENEEMSEQMEDDVEHTSTDTETKESDVSEKENSDISSEEEEAQESDEPNETAVDVCFLEVC